MKFKTQPQALGSLEIGEKVLIPVDLAATLIAVEPPNDRGLCKVTWKLPEVNVQFHTYGTRYTSVDKVIGEEETDE
jgi:hypothetical protein